MPMHAQPPTQSRCTTYTNVVLIMEEKKKKKASAADAGLAAIANSSLPPHIYSYVASHS